MKPNPLTLEHDKKMGLFEKVKEYVSEEIDQKWGDLKAGLSCQNR